MLGVGFAFVPLYRMFCQRLGIPVPTLVVGPSTGTQMGSGISERTVLIRFVANMGTAADGKPLAMRFAPMVYTQRVRLGEPFLGAYEVKNNMGRAVDGVAIHMLYAMGGELDDPSQYVNLQQCFCFTEQHYPKDETVRLPLSFTISPELPPEIHTITFSYTLFEAVENDPRVRK